MATICSLFDSGERENNDRRTIILDDVVYIWRGSLKAARR